MGMDRNAQHKKPHKEMIFAGIILLISLFLAGIIYLPHSIGGQAVVSLAGEEIAAFPLNQDTEYLIESKDGGRNLLVIEDGCAYVREADCPGKDCVNMGKIKQGGQMIACLPHEVIIYIEE